MDHSAVARLTLLGGFEARASDGRVVTLPTRKAEALLAVLACRPGQAHLRERLTAILWSDRSDPQARHSLSQTLSSIRRCFGTPLLAMRREAVTALPEVLEADVAEFRRLAESDAVSDLRRAAELYRGPLLDGLNLGDSAFEEWLSHERAQLHDQAIATLKKLAQREAAGGAIDRAGVALTRALALDPLAEDIHRLVLQLHLDQGAYNSAVRHYRQCADILQRELGTVPEPQTTALYREALSAAASARQSTPSPPVATAGELLREPADDASPGWQDDRPSIAVLPLLNLSDRAEQSYFSDGIAEDIITELSRFRELFVVARHSSFRYRGEAEPKDIARELGVRFLVQGGVRRAGERVRITAQLVEAMTGTCMWADRFDCDLSDVFAIQDEVVQIIVAKIAGSLEIAEGRRARRRRAENLAAYDCYLRGLSHVHSDEREDLAQARTWFERARALDAGYAAPLAMLAMVAVLEGFYDRRPDDHLEQALKLAHDAVALDPNDSWANCALGYINLRRRSFDLAAHYLSQAMRLNPNEPDHIAFGALHHVCTGRPALGLQLMDKAELLNPCTPPWYLAHRGYALYGLQRYGEAAQAFERQIPRPFWDTCFLAACYAQLGRGAEARGLVADALRAMPDFNRAPSAGPSAIDPSDLGQMMDQLRQAGLPAPLVERLRTDPAAAVAWPEQ
jgi:TolB-like protein/DNA-binding SARP family transcriptional activator